MRRIGLPLERLTSTEDLRNVLGVFLTPRPLQVGPAILDIAAADRVVGDGEYARAFDLGKTAHLLKWEQRDGWLAVLPVRRKPLERRGLPIETGTVARTCPFSAGTMTVEGGVPFDVAAAAPVTFTTVHARAKNRHMCWYGTSGAAKGYSLRVLLSRQRFVNGLRVYGIDQDEQQEYAGRFAPTSRGRGCQSAHSRTPRPSTSPTSIPTS